jgi:hypothetical protein
MKNLLYVIAGLVIIIWAIVFFGFESYEWVHMLLVLAGFIILMRLVFRKQLSNKNDNDS